MEAAEFRKWLSDLEGQIQRLTTGQRDCLVDSVLSLCDSHNLFRFSTLLDDITKRDFLRSLPWEIAERILCMLDWRTLLTCREVCHAWKTMVDRSSCAWRSACLGVAADISATSTAEELKELCRQVCVRREKLVKGEAFESLVLDGCPSMISAMHYYDNHIITGSERTVQVWSCDTGECVSRYQTHSIAAIRLCSDIFITASYDCSVVIWNRQNGNKLKSFIGHVSAVFSLDLNTQMNLLATGSADGSVKLWCTNTEDLLQTLNPRLQLWVRQVTICTSNVYKGFHVVSITTDINNNNVNYYHVWNLADDYSVISQTFWSSSDPSILPGFLCHLDHTPPFFLFGLASTNESCAGCTLILCQPSVSGERGLRWFNTGSHYAPKQGRNACLFAGGTRFLMLGSEKTGHYGTVHVLEWTQRDIFDLPGCRRLSCYDMPPRCRFSGRSCVYAVGETDWLYGLHPDHTRGCVLAMAANDKVHIIKWKKLAI